MGRTITDAEIKSASKSDLQVGPWVIYGFAMAMFLFATTVVSYVVYHYILVEAYNDHERTRQLAEFLESAKPLEEASAENGTVDGLEAFVIDETKLAGLETVILASVEQGGFSPFALTIGAALVLFAIMAMVVPHPHSMRS